MPLVPSSEETVNESDEEFVSRKPQTITNTTLYYRMTQTCSKLTGFSGIQWDQVVLCLTILTWFVFGVLAIVTTKILATTWLVPPLLLTTQQLILSSSILRLVLGFTRSLQPWPFKGGRISTLGNGVEADSSMNNFMNTETTTGDFLLLMCSFDRDFVLTGFFNALDFVASNAAFHVSAASFVETVKASEPCTTTAVALIWRIDQLQPKEAISLLILVSGVLLSTYDNANSGSIESGDSIQPDVALESSARTALTIMIANLCFAFRALSQKRYRANSELLQLNDVNLLYRMQQMGAFLLILPAFIAHESLVLDSLALPTSLQLQFIGVAVFNAVSFALYNLASCFVLSHVAVLNHSGLNCLRRMFVTVSSCFVFGTSLSWAGYIGILLCFAGFVMFTHSRAVRNSQTPHIVSQDSGDSQPFKLKSESDSV